MSSVLKIKINVGGIQFEAEGYTEDVNTQRKEFERLLPKLVESASVLEQKKAELEMRVPEGSFRNKNVPKENNIDISNESSIETPRESLMESFKESFRDSQRDTFRNTSREMSRESVRESSRGFSRDRLKIH